MLLARSFVVLVSVACTACGAASSAPPPAPPVVVPVSAGPPSEPEGPSDSDPEAPSKQASKNADAAGARTKTAPGSAFENPVETCGPEEGYEFVANYRCDDGSTPLGGNPRAGARARRGSSGSHLPHEPLDFANSHIVDIYEVPCPSGPVTLYVCLYHCGDRK